MPKSYTNLLTHVVFSTKDRVPSIHADFRSDLFAYMGGIIRELNGKAFIINGTSDHVHIAMMLEAEPSVREAMRVVKANSSRWLHEQYPQHRRFAWQSGYGAFSVSKSNLSTVIRYIERQEEHHGKMDLKTEFIRLLKAHGVDYDERFIWA